MTVEPSVLQVGDIVRVSRPDRYTVTFANKVKDRDAVVLEVGPNHLKMFAGKARLRFLKRNGRGKEFIERLDIRDLIKIPPEESAK